MHQAELYTRLILDEISAGRAGSQRCVAQHLGIALGRANSLMRDLIEHGWVRTRPEAEGARHYGLTPAGRRRLVSLRRRHMHDTVAAYAATRQRLVAMLASVSAACSDEESQKRVVFYGAGDVAEIGYAALRQTDLALVGVVDNERRGTFFEHAIQPSSELGAGGVGGVPFDRLIVMQLDPAPTLKVDLRARAVPRERICWL